MDYSTCLLWLEILIYLPIRFTLFCKPNPEELEYIANVDKEFEELIEEISNGPEDTENRTPRLDIWLSDICTLSLPSGSVKDWNVFTRRDESLADSARLYLLYKGIELPENVPYQNKN